MENEERRRRGLEWRAQHKPLAEVPRRREKSEHRRVQSDLVKAVLSHRN
jgi:hypothetical protein